MNLDIPIVSDTWIQAGGYYKSDGVFFFANSEGTSLYSVPPTDGMNLVICESMSLSTARLYLYLLVVWNSKVPPSTLKRSALN